MKRSRLTAASPILALLLVTAQAGCRGERSAPAPAGGAPPGAVAPRDAGTPPPPRPEVNLARRAWQMIAAGALVVDVRTPQEYASGHIQGALNIPYDQIADRLNELGEKKDRPIVLYCRSGRRAGIALATLRRLGYTNVLNAGGLRDLKQAKPAR